MDASSLFSSANVRFVNEEYEEALKHYTCAITLQDDCAEYLACRAATYLKLGKKEEALKDAEQALAIDSKAHMALHWKGIALFYLGDFASAKKAFEESMRVCPGAKAPRTVWVRKCDAELSGSTLPLGGLAAEASKAAPPVAAAAPRPAPAPVAAPAESATSAAPAASSAPAKKKEEGLTISGRKPIRREWYQNDSQVFVTIFAKEVSREECKVDFKAKELSVTFPFPGAADEEYNLELDLFGEVAVSNCKVDVSKVKVEISLEKKIPGVRWGDLEKKVEVVADIPEQPAYPTSNKQKRDWSQIDRDIDADLKAEKPQGDEALNSLFKQIYERADDETRRAMNKSFQTSGGTVLSTNWGEVAKADYEEKDRPTAPEGQEWRDSRNK